MTSVNKLAIKLPGWLRHDHGPVGALLRRGAVAAAAVLLAAILAFLYQKTQAVDIKRQNEVLSYLRELKEIDARWDVDVLRARTRAAGSAPVVNTAAALARTQQRLSEAVGSIDSPALKRGLPDLTKAFAQKAELVAKFHQAHGASGKALEDILAADNEIAGLVRAVWQDFPQRERLVATESSVAQLLTEAQRYYFSPSDTHRKSLEAVAGDVRGAAARMPPALRDGLNRLDAHIEELLKAKPPEEDIYTRLSFLTAGPRVDSLTNAFSAELEETLGDREIYRVYLIAYSAALLILISYLAVRLAASYRLLNAANVALKSANEGLELRVAERTQELSNALTQLKESEAQLIQTEKMSSLGQMVAGIAHEINTPLAYVKNSLTVVETKLPTLHKALQETGRLLAMLQAGNVNPQALSAQFARVTGQLKELRDHQVLEDIANLSKDGLYGIQQISDIVVNLKDFSRLDRSTVATFSLNKGLESALLLAKHEIKHLKVVKNFGEIPPITCAPSQINQIFINLINNAAQAIERKDGIISITTRRHSSDMVAVDVEDNGKGIPPDVLPRIFDPFFTTKEVGKGTGLGLSIVYKIVEQHGGKITVDSVVGRGTKFTVTLPVATALQPAPTA